MSKPKYKSGKQIQSISEFDQSNCTYFMVNFGDGLRTKHKSFIYSWQYRIVKHFIERGSIFEATLIKQDS
jgi:hypothetical protein